MPGCFEWFPSHCGSKTETESIISGHEDSKVIPTAGIYALETGQKLAVTLKSVVGMIPVPFLSELAEVTVTVLEVCEETIAIEKDVKGLQSDIYTLTLAVIDGGGQSEELRREIGKLQETLKRIRRELDEIKKQNKWLLAFYRKINKERVDKCRGVVAQALTNFQVSHELRVEDILHSIKSKFTDVATDMAFVKDGVTKLLVENTHLKAHTAPSSLPREDMPPPRIFHGRQSFVEDVVSRLVSEPTSRVCITGVGGMGKTTIALAVTQSDTIKHVFQKEYVFWVPCIEAKSADLLRRRLFTQLRITDLSYDSLDPIITELDAPEEDGSKARRLILLDNFETPWLDGADREKVGDILAQLLKLPHLALLVTMTSGYGLEYPHWQHLPLEALDLPAARIVFRDKYRNAAHGSELRADRELDTLLKSVGQIPLAITLMAARGGHLRTSLEDLLEEWEKAGTGMISHGGERSMDDVIGASIHRGVMDMDPDALPLLAVLSMLPAGTTGHNLKWWAPTLAGLTSAVDTLCIAALVAKDDQDFETSRISVLPTIQAYMARQNRIPAQVQEQVHVACYNFVLHHRSGPDDLKFKHDIQALATEESNIQGLLMQINAQDSDIHPNALDALVVFSVYQSWNKPSIVVADHALEVAEAGCGDPQAAHSAAAARQVAEVHRCLGRTLFAQDRYDEASAHFDAARHCFKNLPDGPDLHSAGEAAMELAETWWFLNRQSGLKSLVVEAHADLSHDPRQEYYCARGLLGLGYNLCWKSRIDEALQKLIAAETIFAKLNRPLASTVRCLFLIAKCYRSLGQYQQGLDIAQQGWEEVRQSGQVDLACDIAIIMARCLMALERYDAATDILQQSIPLSRTLGSPLTIGHILEQLGFCSAARMDLAGAIASYTGARIQFMKVKFRLGQEGAERCRMNLDRFGGMTEMDRLGFSTLTKADPVFY